MTAWVDYRELAAAPLVHNKCVRFGTQSYFDCGTSPELSMGGVAPYTLEAWIKPRSVTGGFIVGNLAESSLSIVKGRLIAGRNMGDRGVGSKALHSTTVIETGRWYHVATTFDGTYMVLYVNGRPEVSMRPFTRLKPSGEATLIGAQMMQGRPSNFFLGVIHEVRIWNVARTSDQLFRSMKDVKPASPGLVAHYAFWNTSGERDQIQQPRSFPASGQTGDYLWQGRGLRPTLLT